VKNDRKKFQFHPKYAFDADGTNATKILKKLPKFKKKSKECHKGTENCKLYI